MAYVSKKNIHRWLENYEALTLGDQLPNEAGVSVNSGPKAYDGVTGGRLNKIMLHDALGKLRREQPLTYRCIDAKYLRPILQKDAQRMLNVSPVVFRRCCAEGVDFIYRDVNGRAVNYKALLEAVKGGK